MISKRFASSIAFATTTPKLMICRRPEVAVDDDGAPARPEGHLHLVGHRVDASADLVARVFAVEELFGDHVRSPIAWFIRT